MSDSKKIAFILIRDGSFPPEIRLEKQARACRERGYRTVVLCGKGRPEEPDEERWEESIRIVRKSPPPSSRFEKIVRTLTLVQSRWLEPLDAFIRSERPDLLHVHDLPGLPTVLRVNRRYGIPVIADLHENWPALLQIAPYGNAGLLKRFRRRVAHHRALWRFHEKRALARSHHVLVVCPEARERVLSETGIAPGKVSVVSNTENRETISRLLEQPFSEEKAKHGDFVLLYAGGVARHRGLETVLEALARVRERIPDIRLVIVGIRNAGQKRDLERRVRDFGIESRVECVDWVPASRIGRYIRRADLGLVPHLDNDHTRTTIPHKIFQYMAFRKPIIVSSCPPLRRVVEQSGCGFVFRAGDPFSLAEILVKARGMRAGLPVMGEKGESAALTRYSWDRDKRTLLDLYDRMLVRGNAETTVGRP